MRSTASPFRASSTPRSGRCTPSGSSAHWASLRGRSRHEDAMRAVTFLGNRRLELAEFPDPTPGPGEVVLEIKASGMCGSDLKFYRASGGAASLGLGKKISGPVIAGHEPCGVVAAIGSGVDDGVARIGNRVMVHHYSGCGTCPHCRTGW